MIWYDMIDFIQYEIVRDISLLYIATICARANVLWISHDTIRFVSTHRHRTRRIVSAAAVAVVVLIVIYLLNCVCLW